MPDATASEGGEALGPTGSGGAYETVIVGSRRALPIFQEARAVDVVNAEELAERPGRTLTDLLDEEVGTHAQHTNRGAGAPVIRGQIGPSNLILFDGIRIDNGTYRTGPNQYLNIFDPSALERVEVLRGPGGVLYGSDAIGGVIHLVPRALHYGLGWGSRGSFRYQSADNALLAAPEVSWSSTHLSLVAGGSAGVYDELRAGGGAQVPASGYQQFGARARLGWLPAAQTELSLNYFGAWVLDAGRVDRLYDSNFRAYDNANHLVYARLSHLGEGAFDEVTATLSANVATESERRNDCVQGDVLGIEDVGGDTILTTVDPSGCVDGDFAAIRRERQNDDGVLMLGASAVVHSALPLEGLSLLWGADAYQSFVDSTGEQRDKPDTIDLADPEALIATATRGNFSDGSRYGYYGAFAKATQDLELTDAWLSRLAFGLRLTHVRAVAPDVPDLGDVEYNDTGVTGSAHLSFLRADRVTLYGGLSQGFRPPNLQETTVLGDTGNFFEVPNDGLRAERAAQYELGARARLGPVFFDVVGYALLLSEVIVREPAQFRGQDEVNGSSVVRRVNADEASFRGVEATVAVRVHENLVLRGNLAYVGGEVGENDEEVTPRRLPPLRWLGAVRFEWPRPALYAEVLARGAAAQEELNPEDLADLRICGSPQFPGVLYADLGETCPGTAGWVEVGLRAGMTILERVDLRLSLSNLFDERYRLHGSGFDAPGFDAAIQVDYRL